MSAEAIAGIFALGGVALGWVLSEVTSWIKAKRRSQVLRRALLREISDARGALNRTRLVVETGMQLSLYRILSTVGSVKFRPHIYATHFAEACLLLTESERISFNSIYYLIDTINDLTDELQIRVTTVAKRISDKDSQPGRFETAKDRLKIVDPCKTITGTIVSMAPKPDGDYHIQVKLDPGQSNLLNAKNRKAKGGQHGYLVIEPICQKRPTQPTALKGGPCTGFRQVLSALVQFRKDLKKHIGTHVEVTGAFITDVEHGWNEIHPITSIVIK